jgi:hypothetical protein
VGQIRKRGKPDDNRLPEVSRTEVVRWGFNVAAVLLEQYKCVRCPLWIIFVTVASQRGSSSSDCTRYALGETYEVQSAALKRICLQSGTIIELVG